MEKEQTYEELFIHEIFIGKGKFPGMMALVRKFMEVQKYSQANVDQVEVIIDFLVARAKGEVPTGAKYIREYVHNHCHYKKDSKVCSCIQACLIDQIIHLNKDKHCSSCKGDT